MKLLVLDLDETLVFASETKLARAEDFRVAEFFVYKRPSLDTFLDYAFQHFRVAVWTSSNASYAENVIKQIFLEHQRLEFAWSRQRCTWKSDPELGSGYWIKDLKKVRKLGYSLNSILIVDDSPRKLERSYGNYIRVSAFCGGPRGQGARKARIVFELFEEYAERTFSGQAKLEEHTFR